jgi:hypothetical protein
LDAVEKMLSPQRVMLKNPVLDLPIGQVMRPEIALPLQHVLKIYTVGNFLNAWRSPKHQKNIEQVFDSPQQARHAAATCAAWLGVKTPVAPNPVPAWWPHDGVVPVVSC